MAVIFTAKNRQKATKPVSPVVTLSNYVDRGVIKAAFL